MNRNQGDITNILINPFYCITIHPMLCAEHPPLVSKDQWVKANVNTIKQIGAEAFLRRLLDVLETGGQPQGGELPKLRR